MNHKHTKIISYSSVEDTHTMKLEGGLLRLIHKNQLKRHNTVDSFFADLMKQPSFCIIVLIIIRNFRELRIFLNEKEKLIDRQLILIYPHPSTILTISDESIDMIQDCFKLYPRFVSCMKDDFSDVFLVLKRMITRIENQI